MATRIQTTVWKIELIKGKKERLLKRTNELIVKYNAQLEKLNEKLLSLGKIK